MKVRSLKQMLHWLFLVVGIFCLAALIISVNTYISYAKEGYGLQAELDRANLVDDGDYWLRLRFFITNPGRLDIILEDGSIVLAGNTYNLTNIERELFTQYLPISDLPGNGNTSVVLWFRISEDDFNLMNSSAQADIRLDAGIYVPERHLRTHLVFEDTVEVGV